MFYLTALLAALKLRAQTVHFALSFKPHVKKAPFMNIIIIIIIIICCIQTKKMIQMCDLTSFHPVSVHVRACSQE